MTSDLLKAAEAVLVAFDEWFPPEPDDPNKGRQGKMKAYETLRAAVETEKARPPKIGLTIVAQSIVDDYDVNKMGDYKGDHVLFEALRESLAALPATEEAWEKQIGEWRIEYTRRDDTTLSVERFLAIKLAASAVLRR